MGKKQWRIVRSCVLYMGLLGLPFCQGQAVDLDITGSRVSYGVWSFIQYIVNPKVDAIYLAGWCPTWTWDASRRMFNTQNCCCTYAHTSTCWWTHEGKHDSC